MDHSLDTLIIHVFSESEPKKKIQIIKLTIMKHAQYQFILIKFINILILVPIHYANFNL